MFYGWGSSYEAPKKLLFLYISLSKTWCSFKLSSFKKIYRKRDSEVQSWYTQFIMISISQFDCFSFRISLTSNLEPHRETSFFLEILKSWFPFLVFLLLRVEFIISSKSKDDTYNHFQENEVQEGKNIQNINIHCAACQNISKR